MAHLRRLAAQAGRDPAALGMVLRINPTRRATLQEIADAILLLGDKASVDHCFVDLMHLADTVDQAIETAGRLLELARR